MVVRADDQLLSLILDLEQVFEIGLGQGIVSGLLNYSFRAKSNLFQIQLDLWAVALHGQAGSDCEPCVKLLQIRGVLDIEVPVPSLGKRWVNNKHTVFKVQRPVSLVAFSNSELALVH